MALLVALAAGTVMTAVAGARRGATAVERLQSQTLPATVAVLPNQPGFDWDAVRALPEVEALTTFVLTGSYVVDEVPPDFFGAGFPPGDNEVFRTIERPIVLDGRLPDPSRADEVVISPTFEERYGLGVGDSVTLRLYTPQTQDQLAFGSIELPEPDGPVVNARIVGVIRSPWFGEEIGDEQGGLSPSPGLVARYGPNLLGASGQGILNALVRLRDGAADIPAFRAALEEVSGRSDIDFMDLAEEGRHASEVTRFEADALTAFAAAAGAAAIFLVGQAVARYAASSAADLQVLRAVGLTVGQAGLAAAAGPAMAAGIGSLAGAAASVVASRWFPIGTAALHEPSPGFEMDPPVLLAVGMLTPVLAALGAVAAARLALRSARSEQGPQRSRLAAAARRAGASVPLVVGIRFALEPGRGRQAVPVRPALVGAVVGVLGVVATFTFSHGVDDAAGNPSRFGQVHQIEGYLGLDGVDLVPVPELLPLLAADPDVTAVNDTRVAVAEAGGRPVTLFTLDPVDAPLRPVLVDGRAPQTPAEVALAPDSAESMGLSVGEVVAMTGTAGVREMTVTGLAFVPEGAHNNYITGGWVTAGGYDTLFDPNSATSPAFKYHIVMLAIRPGADPAAVAARIVTAATPLVTAAAEAAGMDPSQLDTASMLYPADPPSRLAEIRQVRTLPVFLAGFLAVLALGAVGHALATAVRRRRHEVAVLRALGMTRRQSRSVVVTQATVLASAGLVVGLPLGVALGRTVWRYVAETTPLVYVAPVAALAVALVVPVALVAANLLAAWPSQRAASMRVGNVLRAE
ncbi:ABC transporter permease [Jiangella asiatica]|uniref:ABC transporter permease n=2 Tax=Jiangella asiatica TaxID=2530372 RepID=A0A4R5CCQ2_9ACTN|nr:ABC transporter permease [Jiangella asiatica]